jgi:peptide/nickel transport system substrate-binding protein
MKKILFILSAVVFFFSSTLFIYNDAAIAASPKRGGVLKVIYGVSPNNLGFGPILQRSDDILAASPAIETLLHVDETGAIEPWLATAFKGDAKAKTIEISLRKGVKFHDGTDFNAEAVKWNLEEYRKSKKPELKKVESIDVINDYTIRLNLSAYDNGIEYSLTGYSGFIVSPAYFKSHGGADGVKNLPVGTGPFEFVSFPGKGISCLTPSPQIRT